MDALDYSLPSSYAVCDEEADEDYNTGTATKRNQNVNPSTVNFSECFDQQCVEPVSADLPLYSGAPITLKESLIAILTFLLSSSNISGQIFPIF